MAVSGLSSAPVLTNSGFSFSTSTPSTSTVFGSFNQGSSTTATVKPMGFATPSLTIATSTAPATGFSLSGFGAAPTSSSGGLTLGTSTAPTTGGFNFANPKVTSSAGGLSGFAAKPTTTGGLGFGSALGQTSSTGGLTLGAPAAKTSTTGGFGFGGFGSTATSGGLTLGTSSAGLPLSGFGATTTSSTGASSLFASKPPASTTSQLTLGGLGGTAPASTAAPTASSGLGGVDPQASNARGPGDKSGNTSTSGKSVKEQNMPPEIVQTIEKFKEHVKEQKSVREKIVMLSCQPLNKIKEQTTMLRTMLSSLTTSLHRNNQSIDQIKTQTAQTLHDCEMAHRTKDTPPGLQYENQAPAFYFRNLLVEFEARMALYHKLIDDTEGYIVSAQNRNQAITPQDLYVVLKRLHDTFVSLAAQLQSVHELVRAQKEQYLTYRRVFLHDETDSFLQARSKAKERERKPLKRSAQPLGSTPFTGMSTQAALILAQSLGTTAAPNQAASFFGQTAAPATNVFGGFGTTGTSGSLLGGTKTSAFGLPSAGTSVTGLFGKPATSTTGGFGTGTSSRGLFSTPVTSKPSAFGFPSATTTTASTNPFGGGQTSAFGAFGSTSKPAFGLQTAAATPAKSSNPFSLQPSKFDLGNATGQKRTTDTLRVPGPFTLQAPPTKSKPGG